MVGLTLNAKKKKKKIQKKKIHFVLRMTVLEQSSTYDTSVSITW